MKCEFIEFYRQSWNGKILSEKSSIFINILQWVADTRDSADSHISRLNSTSFLSHLFTRHLNKIFRVLNTLKTFSPSLFLFFFPFHLILSLIAGRQVIDDIELKSVKIDDHLLSLSKKSSKDSECEMGDTMMVESPRESCICCRMDNWTKIFQIQAKKVEFWIEFFQFVPLSSIVDVVVTRIINRIWFLVFWKEANEFSRSTSHYRWMWERKIQQSITKLIVWSSGTFKASRHVVNLSCVSIPFCFLDYEDQKIYISLIFMDIRVSKSVLLTMISNGTRKKNSVRL